MYFAIVQSFFLIAATHASNEGVRVKAFGVGLAVPVGLDHPRTRRERKPLLVGEHAAGAVADRAHRLPSSDCDGSGECCDDERPHGWRALLKRNGI